MPGIEGLLIGRVLGNRYRIEEVIGRGGMGAVYGGIDERLGRRVAVKVITAGATAEPEARERLRARFSREARAAAGLPHHPNVVPVYDYGTDEALGLDYLVMELLQGSDLADRLGRSGPPPLAEALRILHEAARGVAVGHRAGLIHRDVKPGNIFLAQSQQQELQVRVVDFGIAKLVDEEDTAAQLTQDGRAPHSPAYASPEQLRGLGQLTPASDVFSLGALGFQLLTGERPFSESDRNKMSLGMPVEAPSLRERNPAIPAEVAEVVRKALAFEPLERFPDAGAMAQALDQALRGIQHRPLEPYAASPALPIPHLPGEEDDDRTQLADEDDRTLLAPPPPPRGPRYADLPTGPVGSAPRPAELPPRPPRQWEEPRTGVGGIFVWVLVFLVLAGAGAWAYVEWSRPARPVAMEEPLPEAPEDIPEIVPEETIEEQPPGELDAFINHQEGIRFYNQGQHAEALAQFQRAVQIAPENASYRRSYALAAAQLGLYDEAADELLQALRLDPTQVAAFANLGDVRVAQGDTAAAISAYQRFMEVGTDPRQRGVVERRIRDLQAAQSAPLPADTPTVSPFDPPRPPPPGRRDTLQLPAAAPPDAG
jgi:serine/threonine protein kinase